MATALGAVNLTVTSAPVRQATKSVVVKSTCPRGFWCTAGNNVPCGLNTYNPFVNNQTAEACQPCMENAITMQVASVNRSQCICAKGFKEIYDEVTGERLCVCPQGKYKDAGGMCSECRVGSYKSVEKANEGCTPCLDSTTLISGAAHEHDCVCLPGFFNLHRNGGGVRECLRCEHPNLRGQARGAACTVPGVELTSLPLKDKYWRSYENSTFLWECYTDGLCVAGNGSVTPAGEMFTRRFSHGCRAGSTGPFCELCLDNHYKSDGVCVECTGGGMELIMLLIPGSILALAILGCLVFVGCACRKHAATLQEKLTDHVQGESEIDGNADAADAHTNSTMKDLYKQKTRMRRQMDKGRPRIGSLPCQGVDLSTLQTDFKILVSLIQVLGSLSVTFSIPFPPLYSTVMRWLNVITFSAIFDVMPLSCQGLTFGFHDNLRLRTVFPLGFLLFAYAWTRTLGRCSARLAAVGEKLVSASFFLIFLVYPSTSQNIFNTFNCVPLEAPEPTPQGSGQIFALRVDWSIDCDSEAHRLMQLYAQVMIVVYPIGVPLLYAYMLYVVHGDTMRRMRTNEALRDKLRVEALYKILHDRLERRADIKTARKLAKSGRSSSSSSRSVGAADGGGGAAALPSPPVVLFPTDDEIPADVQKELDALDAKQERMRDGLPDYMKKLISGYRMNNYGFEIFECMRKLALVCMPVFFDPPGSPSQLIFGLMVCFVTFGMYTAISPFDEEQPNVFAQLCQVQIFFALLSSIALKFAGTLTPASLSNIDVLLTILTFIPVSVAAMLQSPLSRLLESKTRGRIQRRLLAMRGGGAAPLIEPVPASEPLPPPQTAAPVLASAPVPALASAPGEVVQAASPVPAASLAVSPAQAAIEKDLSDRIKHLFSFTGGGGEQAENEEARYTPPAAAARAPLAAYPAAGKMDQMPEGGEDEKTFEA